MKNFLQGTWLGHPLHPAVVHIPTALWPAALVFDILSRMGEGSNTLVRLAFYAILLGLLSALIAIPSGIADWSGIKKEKPAWKLGLFHMVLNLLATILWAVNLGLRLGQTFDTAVIPTAPLVLSAIGTLILTVSGYLGGRMVYSYGISVGRQSKKKWREIAESGGARVPGE